MARLTDRINLAKRLARHYANRALRVLPVLFDLAGLTLIVIGVYRLELGRPGIWAIVAGGGLILTALRIQS